MKKKLKINTSCVREYGRNESTKPHQLPIYATSSFVFDSIEEGIGIFDGSKIGHSYSRYGNPTIDTVAKKIASLEAFDTGKEAYAFLTSSGMSAITTLILSILKSGDKLLTQSNLYGGSTVLFSTLLQDLGIETIFTDLTDKDRTLDYLKSDKGIRMIYMETPANPTMALVDIRWISDTANSYGVITAIDNTFCTPIVQRPFNLGVDFVIHSTTKYLNGHGNSISGIIIGHKESYKKKVWNTLKLSGGICSPWDAWLLNNGMKTLSLRMERHCSNALQLAEFLEAHPAIIKVNYNGLKSHPDHSLAKKQMNGYGGMLSFEIAGNMEKATGFMNKLKLCTMAPTLGDVDTLVLHPATSSHINVPRSQRESNGISDSLVRVSVGIEDISDIIEDFDNALLS